MKKLIVLLTIVVMMCLAGCASISAEADGVKASYTRLGDQQITGLSITKTEDGFIVSLQGQKSEAQALSEAIGVLGSLAAKVR